MTDPDPNSSGEIWIRKFRYDEIFMFPFIFFIVSWMSSSSIPEHEHVFPLSDPSLDSEEQDMNHVSVVLGYIHLLFMWEFVRGHETFDILLLGCRKITILRSRTREGVSTRERVSKIRGIQLWYKRPEALSYKCMRPYARTISSELYVSPYSSLSFRLCPRCCQKLKYLTGTMN